MNELSKKVQESEWIGTIGSPSTNTRLNVDILEEAYEKGLVGKFCTVEFLQNEKAAFAIGQIASVARVNPYLERHSVRKITSIRGEANPLTAKHDVQTVELIIGSVYENDKGDIKPTVIGTVPPTGTRVYSLNQEVVDELTEKYSNEITYVGKMYNTNILLPTLFRHFGKGPRGLGEAYHIGIFGKTGSGKSYLARMIMLAYAQHPEMSLLIIDPMGEYAREAQKAGPMIKVLKELDKPLKIFGISNISLAESESLRRILMRTRFFNELGIPSEEYQLNAAFLVKQFFEAHRTGVTTLHGVVPLNNPAALDQLLNYIRLNVQRIYVSPEPRNRVLDRIANNRNVLERIWNSVIPLFVLEQGKIRLEDLINEICTSPSFCIIDLSEPSSGNYFWNDEVMAIVLCEILAGLKETGNQFYRSDRLLNLLIMTDEAHRFVPREKPAIEEFFLLKKAFIDGIRETRKYGLGWFFVSQSIASLDFEILRQLRLYFFGYGLAWGGELRALVDLVGRGGHLDLFQSFTDPQTSLSGEKTYSFMAYGPVSPLSASGAPLFLDALNYFKEFGNTLLKY